MVLQARPDWPLIFMPHEPQIAALQEQRTAREPSSRSFACNSPSRTESVGSRSTSNVSQYAPSRSSGWKRLTFRLNSAIYLTLPTGGPVSGGGHQYVRSCGSHWVTVTSE